MLTILSDVTTVWLVAVGLVAAFAAIAVIWTA